LRSWSTFGWFRRRRDFRNRVNDKASRLIAALGDDAWPTIYRKSRYNLADGGDLGAGQIVHDNDVAGTQCARLLSETYLPRSYGTVKFAGGLLRPITPATARSART
jgi:hypothetical protein